jgi:hypothetical protein
VKFEIIQSVAGSVAFLWLYVRQARIYKMTRKETAKMVQRALWQDRQIKRGEMPNVRGINGSNSGR